MRRPPRWAVGLFAAAFAVALLRPVVLYFAGVDTYRALVSDDPAIVEAHQGTLTYVLGEAAALPVGLFDANESAHLADVRAVFAAFGIAAAVGVAVLVAVFSVAWRSGYALRVVRAGALWSAAAVFVVGLIAAVAFEPAFLAFHYLFFPQGNFLFDPETSNLLRLYPEPYWYGVTLRVGIAFIVAAMLLALGTELIRRSVIVTRR